VASKPEYLANDAPFGGSPGRLSGGVLADERGNPVPL